MESNASFTGKRVVFLGGSSGIGLSTAKLISEQGGEVHLVGRNPEKLQIAQDQINAASIQSFDVIDESALKRFFEGFGKVDHVMATHSGPYYARFQHIDFDVVRKNFNDRFISMLSIAKHALPNIKPGGSITYMGGTTSRKPGPGYAITGPLNDAVETLTKNLAVELAPVRINMIAAGFVNTQLSQDILGDRFEDRISQLKGSLPIARVVEPEDVAQLAILLMTNTALTGVIFDIDGGQHLI